MGTVGGMARRATADALGLAEAALTTADALGPRRRH
jgi:hypothetical protein